MEKAALIVSIISLIVSFGGMFIPIYYTYCQKKEELTLIPCDGYISDNIMIVELMIRNYSWRDAVMVNYRLLLKSNNPLLPLGKPIETDKIGSVLIKGREHAFLNLKYELSDLSNCDIDNIDVYIYLNNIGFKGKKKSSKLMIGSLCRDSQNKPLLMLYTMNQKVKGCVFTLSMRYKD